ncbi:winged helix-turn-helix domain-containing protein [Streptomyces sp. TR02-1]|uniref:winged helix-turn-helix domain-containing protein n=1 Tax=Streptomyces sp. TR02-1 TaxID=3385977 RepID=UPI00399F1AF5
MTVPRLLHGETWLLLKSNGWSWQQPSRRAIERDDDVVELWEKKVWPQATDGVSGAAAPDRARGQA